MNTPYAREHANTKSQFYFDERGSLVVKDAALIFTNFEGAPDRFHPVGGNHNFNLVLSDEFANTLDELGWHVTRRENQDGDVTCFTNISVNMNSQWPPLVILYSESNGQRVSNRLDATTIGRLDKGRFSNINIAINPYEHGIGQYNFKGYLRELRLIALPSNDYFADMDASYFTGE